jgi:competence ComEA-like helix-hairpin-helix protein
VTQDQERGLIFLLAIGLLVGGAITLWPRPRVVAGGWVRAITVYDVAVIAPVVVEPKKIDINAASAVELALLPGIGPVLAERIVAYRAGHGAFATLDQLAEVKGIGASIVNGLRESAVVVGADQ